jgi:hypothetical protein
MSSSVLISSVLTASFARSIVTDQTHSFPPPALTLSFKATDSTQSLSLGIDYLPRSGGLRVAPGAGGSSGHSATWTAPACAPRADAGEYWLQLTSPQTRCNPVQRGLTVNAAPAGAGTNVRALCCSVLHRVLYHSFHTSFYTIPVHTFFHTIPWSSCKGGDKCACFVLFRASYQFMPFVHAIRYHSMLDSYHFIPCFTFWLSAPQRRPLVDLTARACPCRLSFAYLPTTTRPAVLPHSASPSPFASGLQIVRSQAHCIDVRKAQEVRLNLRIRFN